MAERDWRAEAERLKAERDAAVGDVATGFWETYWDILTQRDRYAEALRAIEEACINAEGRQTEAIQSIHSIAHEILQETEGRDG